MTKTPNSYGSEFARCLIDSIQFELNPILAILGAKSATQVLVLAGLSYAIVQTITFSLYLYSAELYPTRLRALGTGLGSAWLRLGSSSGPILVGWLIAGFGIQYVFYQTSSRLTHRDSQISCEVIQHGKRRSLTMGQALAVRSDFTSKAVRRLAQRARNAAQARRLLAIAALLDGASREEAAKAGGMDRQTLRDWVIRFQ